MGKLKNKSITSLFWSISERFGLQIVKFGVSLILARVLLPEEFGLIGMIQVFILLGNILRDAGMTSSLIRTVDADEMDYSTVFYINLIFSISIYGLLYLSAPFVADFFEEQLLVDMVRILALRIPINALGSVQATRLTKKMRFKKQFAIQLPSVVLAGTCGIVLAKSGYGVWSLVYMSLLQVTLATLQFWFTSKWRPKLLFSIERFKTHFAYGYKLTISNIIDTLYQSIYNIVIGKYFLASDLGFFTRAKSTRDLPVRNLSAALNKVTFPVFSEIQNDQEKLKVAYKKFMQQVLFWIAPMLTIAAIYAEPLFRFLFTEKWVSAAPMFQMLSVVGILRPLNAYNLNILKVKGHTGLYLKLEIIKKSCSVLLIFLSIQYGIYALLSVTIISSVVGLFINSYYSGKLIDFNLFQQLKSLTSIVVLTIVVGLLSILFYNFLRGQLRSDFWILSLGGGSAFALYLILAHVLKITAFRDFKGILKNIRAK